MTDWAFVDPYFTNTCVEVSNVDPFRDPVGRWYPAGWLAASSAQERAAIGLKAVTGPAAVPAGKRVVRVDLLPDNGSPVRTNVLEDIPIAELADAKLAAVDAERDRRQQLDFVYDFGSLDPAPQAIDDFENEIAAGERALQMRPADQANWDRLHGQALAAVAADAGGTVMAMRAEDNWNVQTTAAQVLTVCAAMVARNSALLFAGGALKSQLRAARDAADRAAVLAFDPLAGWPA